MAKDKILIFTLENAVKFNGKPNPGAVIGKLIQDDPSVKKKIKTIQPKIAAAVKEVSSWSLDEQKKKLAELEPSLLEKKPKQKLKKELKPLAGAKKVVMRFAPSPSGPMHIGHSYPLMLNSEYCKKYNGKLIIRIEDTNPDKIYEPAYDMIPEDAKWVTGDNVAEIVIQSDRMESYYKYAEELIEKGRAYVCTCDPDHFRQAIKDMRACPCRELHVAEHRERWDKMHKGNGYQPGEAVVRIKTDLKNKNPAMRDWPALRVNTSRHPRQHAKYRVWPLMNFSVAVDDHELGVTHAIRAKDHMDNEKRQKFLYDYMKWKMPGHLYIGRINFEDMKVSCSYARPLVENGTYNGWDDIRLPFLAALKRRGYQPEAFARYAMDVGVTQNDKSVNQTEFFKAMNYFNKQILDPNANRYFFVEKTVEIKIKNAPKQKISMKLHPDDPKRGKREFVTGDTFWVDEHDIKDMKDDDLYRLMDCLNFRKKGRTFVFDSTDYEKYKKEGKKIIHWLPKDKSLVDVEVVMPDNNVITGLGEASMKKIEVGQVVQCERFGFVRLDAKGKNNLTFWFTHG